MNQITSTYLASINLCTTIDHVTRITHRTLLGSFVALESISQYDAYSRKCPHTDSQYKGSKLERPYE